MHQSIGKKNKIIIYLVFLFILSTTSAKFINDQKKLSSSITKINITGLSERKNLELLNNLNNLLYKSIFVINEDSLFWSFINFVLVVLKMNKNNK